MRNKNTYLLLVILVSLFIAYQCILRVIPPDYNDIHDHAAFAREMLMGERPYAGNFLLYLLVNIFSFFSTKAALSEISLCFLIAFATTWRFQLSQQKLNKYVYKDSLNIKNYWKISFFALSLLFVFAIPIPSYFSDDCFMYIGNYVPNVWHNSTIIFLFPFALLLFELSYKQLVAFNVKRNWWILLLVTLNLFIKPSYFFVFVCAYPLLLLIKYNFNKKFWYSILPLIVGLFFLAVEYWVIYKVGIKTDKEASSVIFMPFYKNPEFGDNLSLIPISLLFSMLFPILYSVFNFSRLRKTLLFWYCLISFVISVLVFFFISESGPRASHGNFYWQIVICAWICFFVALVSLLKDFKTEGKTLKNISLLIIFSLHLLMGIFYFIRILTTGGYY